MVLATRHTPKAIVSFSTENGELTVGTESVKVQGAIIDKEVISISTSNDLQTDAGTFQINSCKPKTLGQSPFIQ